MSIVPANKIGFGITVALLKVDILLLKKFKPGKIIKCIPKYLQVIYNLENEFQVFSSYFLKVQRYIFLQENSSF